MYQNKHINNIKKENNLLHGMGSHTDITYVSEERNMHLGNNPG
jgi:hypothetical protein